ncbi:unnamed protein product [Eruca vesicaria subsp. sativa]|uniref:BAG domain-containing protein n=1 Tax=Eruca vesicaria subsp. sativa TaxID=29727 RepID=A0ABC8KMR6_ERUVS|nr:unnamed protein product [Eruca vesicaria subsp. sativa]
MEKIRCKDKSNHTMGSQEEARMGRVVALERDVQGGIRAEDKEFVESIELLMMQMLKLDEIEAEGELKVQRKREMVSLSLSLQGLSCPEPYGRTMDVLRLRNTYMNRSANSQDLLLPRSTSLCFSLAPKTSTIIPQDWELFD